MLIFMAYISLFAFGFLDNVRGPLFPEILRSFSLTDTQGSYFFAVASVGSFLGGLLAQKFLRVLSVWRLNQWSLILISLGTVAMSQDVSYFWVLLFSFLFGVGLGFLGVTVNLMVHRGSSPKNLRSMMSGLHSCYAFAALLAPSAAAYGYHQQWPWQKMLFLSSLLPLIVIVASFWLTQRYDVVGEKKDGEDSEKLVSVSVPGWRMGLFVTACALYVSSELAISTRLALYVRRYGESAEVASYYVSLFFLALFISRLFFTGFSRGTQHFVLLTASLSSALLWLLGLWWHPLFLCLVGLSMGPIFPVSMVYVKELFPHCADRVVAYSISAMSLAVVFMHAMIGQLTDWFDLRVALHLAVLALLLHFVLLLVLPKRES